MSLWIDTTNLESNGPESYRVEISGAWNAGSKVNGGYLAALALKAIGKESPFPDAIASSAFFLSAASIGPAEIVVRRLRVGRTTSSYEANLVQGEKLRTRVTATLTNLDEFSDEFHSSLSVRPDILPIDKCIQSPERLSSGLDVEITKNVQMLVEPGTRNDLGGLSELAWWRFADGTEPDGLSCVLAVDSCLPLVFSLGAGNWCPTLELSTSLRTKPAPGWLQLRRKTSLVTHGHFEEDSEVWDSQGELVMQSRQIARLGVSA